MRHLIPAVVVLALATGARGFAQAGNADAVMAAARAALGGDAKISAVKTFIANGRTRQVRGENLVPIEFEIQAELPDKYSRRDEFPAQDAGPVTAGFVADALVLVPRPTPPPPRPGAPAPPPGQQEAMLRGRLMSAKQDFARLILGMFATSTPAFPLTYSFVGQAEAPQGKADVIDVKGPNNFAARLFIAGDTHLPIMMSWTAPGPPRPTRRTWCTTRRTRCTRCARDVRATDVLCGLQGRRWFETAVPHSPRLGRRDDRRNNLRPLPNQRANRPTAIRHHREMISEFGLRIADRLLIADCGMRRVMRSVLLVVTVSLFCATPTARAQTPTPGGTLVVTVVDSTGAVLPGATVTVTGIEATNKAATIEP